MTDPASNLVIFEPRISRICAKKANQFIGGVSIYLGYLFQKQLQYDRALFYFEQQLQLDTKLQFWDGIANGWFHIGDVYRQKGDLEQAEACYEQCRIICREHGLTKTVPTTK